MRCLAVPSQSRADRQHGTGESYAFVGRADPSNSDGHSKLRFVYAKRDAPRHRSFIGMTGLAATQPVRPRTQIPRAYSNSETSPYRGKLHGQPYSSIQSLSEPPGDLLAARPEESAKPAEISRRTTAALPLQPLPDIPEPRRPLQRAACAAPRPAETAYRRE